MVKKFSQYCQSALIFVLHLLCVLLPIFFLVSNEELFEFNKMLMAYAAAIIIFTLWAIRCFLEKKLLFRRTPFDIAVLVFLLSQLVSTALSIHLRTSLFGYYTRFHGGLFSTLTYILFFYAAVTHLKKKQVWTLLGCIFLGSFFASLYAFPEHFGHSPSCLLLDGKFTADCWIQDVQSRVFGTFGQPNWLAAYLILLLPILVMSAVMLCIRKEGKKSSKKWLMIAGSVGLIFLISATILFTKSRSGFLGIAAGLGITGILSLIIIIRKKLFKQTLPLAAGLTILLLSIGALFGTPFTPGLSSLLAKKSAPVVEAQPAPVVDRLEAGGTDSGDIRRIVWKGAIDVWKRYPLFGSGVETFAYSYYRDRPMEHNMVSEWDFLYNKAHNELLNFLATTGAFGLFAYLFLQGSVIFFLARRALFGKNTQHQLLAAGILGGLIALHISNFFGFSTVMVTVLMYLLPGIFLVNETEDPPVPTKETTINGFQGLGIGVATIVGLFLLMQVFVIWFADRAFAQSKQAYKSGDYETAFKRVKTAIDLSPQEGLYFELYSKIASEYALAAAQQKESDAALQFANSAIEASNVSIQLNPVHLNFFKTRNQVLLTLAQFEPQLYDDAKKTLLVAQGLAPTDPKLVYFMGIIQNGLGENDEAQKSLEKAVEMKPNYDSARFQLGQVYENKKNYPAAIEQYKYILEKIAPDNEQVKQRLEAVATFSAKKK